MNAFLFFRRFLFLLLFLVPCLSSGQYRFSWGEEMISKVVYPFIDVIEYHENVYVALRDMNKFFTGNNQFHRSVIKKVSLSLKSEKEVRQKIFIDGEKVGFKKFIKLDNKLFFLGWKKSGLRKQKMIICEFDTTTLLPGKLYFEFVNHTKNPFLFITDGININKDNFHTEKLIIVSKIYKRDSSKIDLEIIVLDSDLNNIYGHKPEFKLVSDSLDIRKMQIDGNGNLYVTALERPKKIYSIFDFGENGITKGHLWKITPQNGKEEHLDINLSKEKYLQDINLWTNNEQVFVIGLYSNEPFKKRKSEQFVKGIFIFKTFQSEIDYSGVYYYEIERDILHDSLGKFLREHLDAKDETQEIQGLKIKEILPWRDDRFLVISEVSYITKEDNFKYDFSSLRGHRYKLEDIIVFCFDLDGHLIWMNNIRKYGGSFLPKEIIPTSYFFHLDEEKIDFFYNGPLKVIDRDGKLKQGISYSKWALYFKTTVFHTSLSYSKGEKKFEILYDGALNRKPINIYLRGCFPITENEYLLYVSNSGNRILGLMEFD